LVLETSCCSWVCDLSVTSSVVRLSNIGGIMKKGLVFVFLMICLIMALIFCVNHTSLKHDVKLFICTTTINNFSDNGEIYFLRGNEYFFKRQYDLAIEDYTNAIYNNFNDARVYRNRGGAYHFKKQEDLAIADYTKAIDLDPKDAKTYFGRGFSYKDKEQYELAIADVGKAIELDPKFSEAYLYQGYLYKLQNLNQDAIKSYKSLIKNVPNDVKSVEEAKKRIEELGGGGVASDF